MRSTRFSLWARFALVALVAAICEGSVSGQSSSVTLAWDPNTEDVAGYRVYVGTRSRAYEQVFDVGLRTTFTFPTSGSTQRYYFVVSAYLEDGSTSLPSDEVASGPPVDEGAPPHGVSPPPPVPGHGSGSAGRGSSSDADTSGAAGLRPHVDSVQAACAGDGRCYDVATVVRDLDRVSAVAVADDVVFVVDDGRRLHAVDLSGASGVALQAVGTRRIVAVAAASALPASTLFVAMSEPRGQDATEISIVRYRWLNQRLVDGVSIVSGLAMPRGGPRLAVGGDGHLYVAVPASGARRDPYSGSILRFTPDGAVPAGNPAASPVIASGLDTPTTMGFEGGVLWVAGLGADWRVVAGRVPLDILQGGRGALRPVRVATAGQASFAAQAAFMAARDGELPTVAAIDARAGVVLASLGSGDVWPLLLRDADDDLVADAVAAAGDSLYVGVRHPRGGGATVLRLTPRR